MVLSPTHGGAQTIFIATFHLTTSGGPGACLGSQVQFAFDSQPVGSAPLDASCSASAQMQVPLGATPGVHKVRGSVSGGATSASGTANFTVDNGTTPPPSTGPSTPATSATTSTSTSSAPPSWSNSTTPYVPWTAPPFVSQAIPTSTGPCDTSGPHAPAADKGFLLVPAYSAGAHPKTTGSTLITEPASGALPITALGPAGMVPPLLGDGRHPYQYLELLQPIDDNVSPKLRLAAAAGEPFGCLHVESFGGPNSGYGYLSYALKEALVISVQDANPDGTPFQEATPTAPPSTPAPPASPAKGAKAPPASPPPPAAPKAKFEKVVLGYTSVVWEYQEAAGAQAPIHRGSGTIQPPAPSPPLSYSNLVFAFGGLVAATVALMFAYHSRRRDLARRARRQRASHAS
ncbi:MAG: hypothetical protein HOW97_32390 [Catenulispora sp.]|nr:hypothetical protein [Catenulispora sp.]